MKILYSNEQEPLGFLMQSPETDDAVAINATVWYSKNLQGDIVGLYYAETAEMLVQHSYDAWRNPSFHVNQRNLGTAGFRLFTQSILFAHLTEIIFGGKQ